MPSCYTHQFYANKILELIDTKIKNKITNIELYLDGALGPDPLYFYLSIKGLSLYKKSCELHSNGIKDILIKAKDSNDTDYISFLFGLLTHYIFDKNIHKYIYEINPTNDLHILIESELDKRLALKYYNNKIKFHKDIKYKGLSFYYINKIYSITPFQMKNSLFMMRNAISYSMTYNKIKRFIFKSFLLISFKNKKYKDLQIKYNDDHRVDEYLLAINDIITKSIEEILLRFNEFNDYLDNKIEDISFGNKYNFEGKLID